MNSKVCGSCTFYREKDGSEGFCHYNPPTVVSGIQDGNGVIASARPPVKEDDLACHGHQFANRIHD